MALIVRVEEVLDDNKHSTLSKQTFTKSEITIGRGPKNDIVLNAPDVSSKHAFILLREKGAEATLYVKDNGSSNGTFLENTKLEPNIECELVPKQRLVISRYVITTEPLIDPTSTSAIEINKIAAAEPKTNGAQKKGKGQINLKEQALEQEYQLKAKIHNLLLERLNLRRQDILSLSEEALRERASASVEEIITDLRWEIPEGLNRDLLLKQILDEALGLGPLEELIADESVSEIMVNSYRKIYAERAGKLSLTPLRFSSEQAVLAAIERILAPIGRRIDEGSPLVDARLKDGSRVNAVIRPLALEGPCITIRKFQKVPLTINDLVKFGALSQGMAEFLDLAVKNRLNIVISGGTGSGKTTLLNVVSSFIPEGERVITVEDAAELQLPRDHIIKFETRPPNLEGKGAIAIRDLVRNALRMRPDRIIVGECRGAEALDMLQAMNTGHDGSMTTGHANSPGDMIARLETMVLMSGVDLPVRAIREQISSAVHIVLQQTRFSCGSRKVTAISEVTGIDYDEERVILQDIFLFKQDGYGENGKIHGKHQATGYVPEFFRKMQERGLAVNAEVFSPN